MFFFLVFFKKSVDRYCSPGIILYEWLMKASSKQTKQSDRQRFANVFDIHEKVNKSQALIVLVNIPLSQFL